MDKISNDFNPNKKQHKSPWAFILILMVIILFGIFWITQYKKPKYSVIPVRDNSSVRKETNLITPTFDLQASTESIEIPNYSESQ